MLTFYFATALGLEFHMQPIQKKQVIASISLVLGNSWRHLRVL